MVLADTSVWIDHLRHSNAQLLKLLSGDKLCMHALVIEELACGNLTKRERTINDLSSLRRIQTSSHEEVMNFIQLKKAYGSGLSAVDVNLITSCLFAGADLLTHDKRLARAWAMSKR
ncbi:MAG: PIN domain-containing protein [Spirochaetes bacterium]|nr:PIN domain-containing protein [Spirochaetota bacterium]